jgi:hypothetical protein
MAKEFKKNIIFVPCPYILAPINNYKILTVKNNSYFISIIFYKYNPKKMCLDIGIHLKLIYTRVCAGGIVRVKQDCNGKLDFLNCSLRVVWIFMCHPRIWKAFFSFHPLLCGWGRAHKAEHFCAALARSGSRLIYCIAKSDFDAAPRAICVASFVWKRRSRDAFEVTAKAPSCHHQHLRACHCARWHRLLSDFLWENLIKLWQIDSSAH